MLLGLWPAVARGQDINPDRPDLTTSAELVPAGALQLETGLEYERARVGGGPAERRLGVQAVLRAGLGSVLEVSLESEPPSRWSTSSRPAWPSTPECAPASPARARTGPRSPA